MNAFLKFYDQLAARLHGFGAWFAPLGLRLLLGHEFWKAGTNKLGVGSEAPAWFVNQDFVFPFGLLSANANWFLVTWGEIVASLAIILGLFTRFFAFTLLVITVVAIAAVHWPASWESLAQLWQGYSVSRVVEDGEFRDNFRIPFLFLAMILPLLFLGGGKLSLDHAALHLTRRLPANPHGQQDAAAFAIGCVVLGLAAVYLVSTLGLSLLLLSAGLFVLAVVRERRVTRALAHSSPNRT